MTNEVKNVPEVRFPEFSGEWKKKQLGDVTKTNQGLQIAISDRKTEYKKGLYFYITNEFLRPNSQTKYYIENPPESVIAEKNDILMTRTGNTGKVITNVEGAFHNNFFKIKYNKSIIDRLFLFELLKSPKINNKFLSLAGTSTIPDLNHSDFYSVYISFPTISEQQKIGGFFSKLDRQIELEEQKLEKLEEQKKGYMQKIFSHELRFKDENGEDYPEWEIKQLKEILKFSNKRTTKENEYPILTSSRKGLLLQSDYYKEGKTFANSNVGYFILPKNFITYRSRSDDGIFKFNLNQIIDTGIISKYYPVFKGINSNQYYLTLHLNNQLEKEYIKYATGTSQLVLSHKNLQEIKTKFPFYDEQTKIADFFIKFDELIEKQNLKIDELKERKKGFLQKMFI